MKILSIFIINISLLIFSNTVWSVVSNQTIAVSSSIVFQNPLNAVPDNAFLSNGWQTQKQSQMCSLAGTSNYYNKAELQSLSISSGHQMKVDGVNYTIFTTTIPGIGWIMAIKDKNASTWSTLGDTPVTTYPYPGSTSQSLTLGAEMRFAYVKMPGDIPSGVTILPQREIASLTCTVKNTGNKESAKISVTATTFNLKPLTCAVGKANFNVPLGDFSKSDLPGINNNFGSGSVNVELTCEEGIRPAMTITDAVEAGNTSNIITLTPNSTATGVGVQVFFNNMATPKNLGADSREQTNSNQFFIFSDNSKKTQKNEIVNIPLTFKYIQTSNNVQAGTANAVATLTFSYQ